MFSKRIVVLCLTLFLTGPFALSTAYADMPSDDEIAAMTSDTHHLVTLEIENLPKGISLAQLQKAIGQEKVNGKSALLVSFVSNDPNIQKSEIRVLLPKPKSRSKKLKNERNERYKALLGEIDPEVRVVVDRVHTVEKNSGKVKLSKNESVPFDVLTTKRDPKMVDLMLLRLEMNILQKELQVKKERELEEEKKRKKKEKQKNEEREKNLVAMRLLLAEYRVFHAQLEGNAEKEKEAAYTHIHKMDAMYLGLIANSKATEREQAVAELELRMAEAKPYQIEDKLKGDKIKYRKLIDKLERKIEVLENKVMSKKNIKLHGGLAVAPNPILAGKRRKFSKKKSGKGKKIAAKR